ncbi:MAG: hypothetical protein M1829_005822 [Trizodia sp. TS-e1964]|nr:MAG: hypothetical protein M1829_005822 [Trizodia sp. TS-e1964]
MAKDKKGQKSEDGSSNPPDESHRINASIPATPTTPSPNVASKKGKTTRPTPTTLIICRNKHWRYISSFHGPWLQLPPEVLESLAYTNFLAPRPRPIDPAVFFDLVKIRRLVDDATNLAVRAASGVTSSSLNNASNANNGLLIGPGASFGLGIGGGSMNSRLSRERKHRMRELATHKLSKAYHLDEIATSVATMQSTSTLEDVAKLVLQRAPLDLHAKYVHFFHEKIPSRTLAQCTSLQPLDEVIAERPNEAEPYRTRAVTRIFKGDYFGAIKDFTEGLSVYRYNQSQHTGDENEIELSGRMAAQRNGILGMSLGRALKHEFKVEEKDQPSSLECQLLFHRAGVHLTIACQHIELALKPLEKSANSNLDIPLETKDGFEREATRLRLEARKIVKTNAKRALRDYISFMAHIDYSPGFPTELAESLLRKMTDAGYVIDRPPRTVKHKFLENPPRNDDPSLDSLSAASILSSQQKIQSFLDPTMTLPKALHVSTLFSPSSSTPFPTSQIPVEASKDMPRLTAEEVSIAATAIRHADPNETITYHPLLTDALHSMLLCHCLIQTSTKELMRHACMVARLSRIADGYPIFLAPRSPSRADWIEVVKRAGNWVGLKQSWESMCTPIPQPAPMNGNRAYETPSQTRERLKHENIMEALEDEGTRDEPSFQAHYVARERRLEQATWLADEVAKRKSAEDGIQYPLSTDRADVIARWVREAPVSGAEGSSGAKKNRNGKKPSKGKERANDNLEAEMMKLELDKEAKEEVD